MLSVDDPFLAVLRNTEIGLKGIDRLGEELCLGLRRHRGCMCTVRLVSALGLKK